MDKPRPLWPWIVATLIGAPMLYVASFGPACWAADWAFAFDLWPDWAESVLGWLYDPLIWASDRSTLIRDALAWYGHILGPPMMVEDF